MNTATVPAAHRPAPTTAPLSDGRRRAGRIADDLRLLAESAPVQRRVVKAGEMLYRPGQDLDNVYVVSTGMFKSTTLSADGRAKVVGFHPRGSWLGFEALAEGRHANEMVALDVAEVMFVAYEALLEASTRHPVLMRLVHRAMSLEQARQRESLLAMGTLSADARVADFLRDWAEALAAAGLRNDQVKLRMSRADIGSYLGLTIETVSRAFSRLQRHDLIRFDEPSRREIRIPHVGALARFVQQSAAAHALQ
jgi:CRP/FNR family transcriptional regulator